MNILQEADILVNGDRNKDYGSPLEDWTRTAKIWSAILGCDVKPEQVGLCMIGLKISRQCHKSKRDNLVDIAGYAGCIEKLEIENGVLLGAVYEASKESVKQNPPETLNFEDEFPRDGTKGPPFADPELAEPMDKIDLETLTTTYPALKGESGLESLDLGKVKMTGEECVSVQPIETTRSRQYTPEELARRKKKLLKFVLDEDKN